MDIGLLSGIIFWTVFKLKQTTASRL